MSTAVEIEAALERLPSAEKAKLRDRLLERTATKPKTGAGLAALWPVCFHLTTQEADDFARELQTDSRMFGCDPNVLCQMLSVKM